MDTHTHTHIDYGQALQELLPQLKKDGHRVLIFSQVQIRKSQLDAVFTKRNARIKVTFENICQRTSILVINHPREKIRKCQLTNEFTTRNGCRADF